MNLSVPHNYLDFLLLFQSKKNSSPANFPDAEMGVNIV